MAAKKIRLFLKPWCPWCQEAIAWLDQRKIAYEGIDVTADRNAAHEMIDLSKQTKAPVIEVDGEILADFDVKQLAEFWKRFN